MGDSSNGLLALGGLLSFLAAAAHLACIAIGAPAYRAMGAGEGMAKLAESGHWYPTAITLAISSLLAVWGLYAFSGAGVVRRLPFLRSALCAIATIYLARAVAFPLLTPYFPGNSLQFWVISSAICFVLGATYMAGIVRGWSRLGAAVV